MTSDRAIEAKLQEAGLDEYESIVYMWQYDKFGGFMSRLMELLVRADDDNFIRLSRAFPTHAEAITKYRSGLGWWGDAKEKCYKAGLNID